MKKLLNLLLVFVPAAIAVHYLLPESHTLAFVLSCLAIIPLAGWMGTATEHLAERAGEGIGGFLNATFGNAAELIIALVALRKGMTEIVKASITGSIIGNLLLVLGLSVFAGGLRRERQRFSVAGARIQATMLFLATVALVTPAVFHSLRGSEAEAPATERTLSVEISIVMLVTYALGLLFTLRTHRHLFDGLGVDGEAASPAPAHGAWSVRRSLGVLAGATALVAWVSEILIGSVEHAAGALGMSHIFVGVVVVAVVGNAAEHSTAVLVAVKDRMDLSLSIAIGSSIQVALLLAPILVLASYFIAPQPMDLVFMPAEVMAVALSVLVTGQIANDGESNWLEGVQLLAVYVILGMVFYFL